jgi:hypothetical protein
VLRLKLVNIYPLHLELTKVNKEDAIAVLQFNIVLEIAIGR